MQRIEDIAEYMTDKSLLLVTAESCTAGLIAATLADIPGAGQLLDCAFVVYSPYAKQRCLNVKDETLAEHNLTSEPVAKEMAIGALHNSRANVAVSNTGVADNSTDDDIPAGTQCYAWAFRDGADSTPTVFTETRQFTGNRTQIRVSSAHYALTRIPYYFDLIASQKNSSTIS